MKAIKYKKSMIIFFCWFNIFILDNRYQRKKDAKMRRMILSGPDLQLDRLRVASDSMMTEYNPNYEFGGGVYSLRDLKEIPREHLQLVKWVWLYIILNLLFFLNFVLLLLLFYHNVY